MLSWNVKSKIAFLSYGPLLVLILVGVSTFFSVNKLIEVNKGVEETTKAIRLLQTLIINVVDASTGMRGYILTEDASYLEPYLESKESINDLVAESKELIKTSNVDEHKYAELKTEINQYFDYLSSVIELDKKKGYSGAITLIKSNVGNVHMQHIRSLIGAMIDKQLAVLQSREQEAKLSAQTCILTIIFATLVSLSFITLIGQFMSQTIVKSIRRLVLATRTMAGGRFEPVKNVKSNDELGELADAFNHMGKVMSEKENSYESQRQITEKANSIIEKVNFEISILADEVDELFTISSEHTESLAEDINKTEELVERLKILELSSDKLGSKLTHLYESLTRLDESCQVESHERKTLEHVASLIVNKQDKVIKQVYGLAANSKSLSDVLARLDEIANQINLLTLSTVMEISRKDSESNTFNILADELRKLSKQTKDDNLQSRKIISDIQSQSKHMEVLEEELSGITTDAVKMLALSTERSLEISNQMQFLKDSSEVLQEEYEIDGKEFTEIRHSIDKLRLSMGRHSYLAKQVSQETAELTHLRNRLKESVNYFHSNGNGHVEEESMPGKLEAISQEKESI